MNTALIVAGAAALVVYLAGRKVAKRDAGSPEMGGAYGGASGSSGGGGGGVGIGPLGASIGISPVGGVMPVAEPAVNMREETISPMGPSTLIGDTVARLNLGDSSKSDDGPVLRSGALSPTVSASSATATPLTESAAPVSATMDRYSAPLVTSFAVSATPLRTSEATVARLSAPVATTTERPTLQTALAAYAPRLR